MLVDPLESHIQSLCNFRQISVQCKNSQGEKRNKKNNVSSHHVRTQCVLILEKLGSTAQAHSRSWRAQGLIYSPWPEARVQVEPFLGTDSTFESAVPGQNLLRIHVTSPWSTADPSHSCVEYHYPSSSHTCVIPSLWKPLEPMWQASTDRSGISECRPQLPIPQVDNSGKCSLCFSSEVLVESRALLCSCLSHHTLTAISLLQTASRSYHSALSTNLTESSLLRTPGTKRNQADQQVESDFSLM